MAVLLNRHRQHLWIVPCSEINDTTFYLIHQLDKELYWSDPLFFWATPDHHDCIWTVNLKQGHFFSTRKTRPPQKTLSLCELVKSITPRQTWLSGSQFGKQRELNSGPHSCWASPFVQCMEWATVHTDPKESLECTLLTQMRKLPLLWASCSCCLKALASESVVFPFPHPLYVSPVSGRVDYLFHRLWLQGTNSLLQIEMQLVYIQEDEFCAKSAKGY